MADQTVTPATIAVLSSFATMTSEVDSTVTPAVIASLTSLAAPTISTTVLGTTSPATIDSLTTFGTLSVGQRNPILLEDLVVWQLEDGTPWELEGLGSFPYATPTIASLTSFAVPVVQVSVGTLPPQTIDSTTTFGVALVHVTRTATPTTIASLTTFGAATATVNQTPTPATIHPLTTFGAPVVSLPATPKPLTVDSTTTFGAVVISISTTASNVTHISTTTFLPTPAVFAGTSITLQPTTFASITSLATPGLSISVDATVTPATIGSLTTIDTVEAPVVSISPELVASTILSSTSFDEPVVTGGTGEFVSTVDTILSSTSFDAVGLSIAEPATVFPATIYSSTLMAMAGIAGLHIGLARHSARTAQGDLVGGFTRHSGDSDGGVDDSNGIGGLQRHSADELVGSF